MQKWLRRMSRGKKHRFSADHFKGGWLHLVFGEAFLTPALWEPRRDSVAGGVALGLFIGLTPTMGAQVLLGAIGAYLLKVNVPVAVTATLITNPFTAPIVYTLEYQLGVWLVGAPAALHGEEYRSIALLFSRHAGPLLIGAMLLASLSALAGYALTLVAWRYLADIIFRHKDVDELP